MGPTEQAPGDEAGTQEGAIAAPGQTAQDGSKEQPGGNDDGDAAEQGADEGAADPAMEKPEAAEGGEEGLLLPVEGSASAARAVAAARMELQVEEMEALVSKVELVAAEAEAAATALQVSVARINIWEGIMLVQAFCSGCGERAFALNQTKCRAFIPVDCQP